METILNYRNKLTKFKKRILNFSINHEKNIKGFEKNLSTEQYKKIITVGNRPETLCSLKVNKVVTHVCPPLDLYSLQLELLVTNLRNF